MSISQIFQKIATDNFLEIKEATSLRGGDINEVTLLSCTTGDFVLKTNCANRFPKIFSTEAKGLSALEKSKSFLTPKVINEGRIEETLYLLLEYIPPSAPSQNFNENFAKQLTQLHRNTQTKFGLDHSNYIGSLPQYNSFKTTAASFYIEQRLQPQLEMANNRGFLFSNVPSVIKNITNEIPNEPSGLIHGDLWNGNYLISERGQPVLIDPAVAYAPREMDLAMMHLFGGFSDEIFNLYNEIYPLEQNWKNRIDLWQLYYLLVHLNLFGSSYLHSVSRILKKYS